MKKMTTSLFELIQRFRRAGSTQERCDAAEAVVIHVAPSLFLYLHPRVPESVEEIRENVLVEIALCLERCTAQSEAEAWGWCYSITRNKLAAHFQDKHSQRFIPMDPAELNVLVDFSGALERFQSEKEKAEAIDALESLRAADPECFARLWDYFVVGMDYQDMVASTGLRYDAVRVRIYRCLEKAEQILRKAN